MRSKTLTAYGTEDDVQMLAVLSEQSGKTASSWIIDQIREAYERQFGTAPPALLRKSA